MQHTLKSDAMQSVRERLKQLADPAYAKFQSALLRKPGEETLTGSAANYLGVRLPALRKLAEELAQKDWLTNLDSIRTANRCTMSPCYEEVMLEGMLIGLAKDKELPEQLRLTAEFVPLIDNWGVCDSFCAGLKTAAQFPETWWEFLMPYLKAENEYEVRFGIVMLIDYFISNDDVDRVLRQIDAVCHEGYYVKMAAAWAISICYVKSPEKTMTYLQSCKLDTFTYRKALTKIVESKCVSERDKEKIRQMRSRFYFAGK